MPSSAPHHDRTVSGIAPLHDGRVEVLERAVHDLKNPLAVVRASLEWLEMELQGREDMLDAIDDATAASNRLATIIDDLDTLARLGKEGVRIRDAVAIVPLVESVVSAAAERFTRRGLSAVTIAAGDMSTHGDPALLERSITALVDAAARGAPAGSRVEVTVEGGEIGFALAGSEDAGGAATLDALESAGLGVYVALRAVEAHGGSLQVIPTTLLPRITVRLPS
jgi:K+-sensing histidine kinase KdpD